MYGILLNEIDASFSTAFTAIQTDAMSALTTIAPIAIGVFGAFLVWKLGKKFFSQIAK